jgi:hypothetical protein
MLRMAPQDDGTVCGSLSTLALRDELIKLVQ